MISSLNEQIAIRALRNGEVIEQFLGATDPSGPRGIAFVSIWPYPGGRWAVALYEMVERDEWDGGIEDLPPLEKREKRGMGRDLVLRDTPRAALEYAERVPVRAATGWVSCFKLDRQYWEWVDAGRPPLR